MYYLASDSVATSFSKCFALGPKGSGATHARAQNTFIQFEAFCKAKQFGCVRPDTITAKQARQFIEHRIAHGIAKRTLQNEISHVRRAMRGAGRNLGDIHRSDHPFSNRRCGLERASRKSYKAPCSMAAYESAIENGSDGLEHVLRLQKVLGLRAQEAVIAGNLSQWVTQFHKTGPNNTSHLLLTFGTKGGRPRHIRVHPHHLDEVRQVVLEAHAYKQVHGHIIKAKNLKKAMRKYHNEMTALGLTGDNSGHGLRRLFAWQQFKDYLASGLSEQGALASLSMDLGHGEGRGRWVKNNYLCGMLEGGRNHG